MSYALSSPSDDLETQSVVSPAVSTHLAGRPPNQRAFSHGSQRSAADLSQQHSHSQVASYNPRTSPRQGPHPILVRSGSAQSPRRPHRSTSISSSLATRRGGLRDDDPLSEADEEREDDKSHHSTARRRRGKGVAKGASVDNDGDDDDEGEGEGDDDDDDDGQREGEEGGEDDPITLKERQSLINVQHPFGLPIWKPALYKKSRSVTRYADQALHSVPSYQAERHLLPGNIFWLVAFGWWLAGVCFLISIVLFFIPRGGKQYATLVFGLGWYLAWPFGKYLEGVLDEADPYKDEFRDGTQQEEEQEHSDSDVNTVRGVPPVSQSSSAATGSGPINGTLSDNSTVPDGNSPTPSFLSGSHETTSLLRDPEHLLPPLKSYGATPVHIASSTSVHATKEYTSGLVLGKICFWIAFICIIAPLMLIVCAICWAFVVTIPMAKLNWALVKYIFAQPTTIRFCAAPPVVVMSASHEATPTNASTGLQPSDGGEYGTSPALTATQASTTASQTQPLTIKPPRLSAGQAAPSGVPKSTVLLCTYRGAGLQYYKYTVGGVNIMFINLLPIVFFVIFDGFVLLPMAERLEHEGKHVPALLRLLASQVLIFVMSLLSVIPLSYFIGMAVASISAQSSIGMGAVINATFGSIIEILLYSIALTQGKGRLVEGSVVGSLLAGVLLMPGMSMCSSALRRKEQKFNAKSASVTSMMLIMAIIGALTPTLFYQTYGNFQLICTGCPSGKGSPVNAPWVCEHCYYKHPDPADDPLYQSTVKSLMYFCAIVLLLSYLIGLWFSLRTHAAQIWQNPQQLLHHQPELPLHTRISFYQRFPGAKSTSLRRKISSLAHHDGPRDGHPHHQAASLSQASSPPTSSATVPPPMLRVSYAGLPPVPAYTQTAVPSSTVPVLESVSHAVKTNPLPDSISPEMFTNAVTAATVSALRHQEASRQHTARLRGSAIESDGGGHGGHDAPSWSRLTSASVLLACTALYAVIAELLVDVVDVVLEGSGIDEKFLGVTLFALVPNTTEFMNAISFALHGNIALSMEIGSAYALQVCLLQIPAMVAFSAWYDPKNMGEVAKTFTLIFPRWDVVVIILSMFLLTYTYIDAKSNYHRGSILILSYLVLTAGFYFAPSNAIDIDSNVNDVTTQEFPALTFLQSLQWYLPSLY